MLNVAYKSETTLHKYIDIDINITDDSNGTAMTTKILHYIVSLYDPSIMLQLQCR
jgi:hypothetical protein